MARPIQVSAEERLAWIATPTDVEYGPDYAKWHGNALVERATVWEDEPEESPLYGPDGEKLAWRPKRYPLGYL